MSSRDRAASSGVDFGKEVEADRHVQGRDLCLAEKRAYHVARDALELG